jgi:lipopolysaccharide transport system permease protein
MFASAVFYPISKIPPACWEVMKFNPVLLAIELARDSLLWQQPIRATHLGYLYGSGAIACYVGHWAFRRLKPAFADVI